MKNRKVSAFIFGLTFAGLLLVLLTDGFGMAPRLTYLPIVVKNPLQPTPVGPVGGTFTALAVDPNLNQNVYAGSYVSGVYKTTDEGNTWYQMNNGLGNLKIQSLATHPTNSNIVYAGTYGGGIYKSSNAGASWTAVNGGVLGNHIVYDLEIDPTNPAVIYAATRVNPGLKGYLYKSTNSGLSWSLLLTGEAFSKLDYFYDIDVNPLNSSELYLTAHEHGFYKSTNGGASFFPINNGVGDWSARSFALDTAYPGLVYGAVWHDDAAYRSWNSGASWSVSRVGLPVNTAVFRLYTDPFGGTQKRVFACTYGNGLYSSENFAQNWTSRGLAGQRLYDFIVTNSNTPRWFAATESNGVYRTNAGSGSWKSVMGDLRLNAVTAIVKDEQLQRDYAAVYGKGVFEIDQSGLEWNDISISLTDKDVTDLAFHQGSLYVLTETSLYLLAGDNWVVIELPFDDNRYDLSELDWLAQKVGLPGEVLLDHIEYQRSLETDATNYVLPYRLFAFQENLYMATLDDSLYLRVDDSWEKLDKSSFIGVNLDQFMVNQILPTETGLLAATGTGLFRVDNHQEKWTLITEENREILALAKSHDCAIVAAGKGFLLYSTDCAASWAEVALEDWHYQSIGYLGDRSDLILLGSRENGASILLLP